MNSRQHFTLMVGVGVGFVVLVLGAMYAPPKPLPPPAPPKVVQKGDTKTVRDNAMYAKVFDSCMDKYSNPSQCRYTAEEASNTEQYWDGSKWVKFNYNLKGE
ncbi:hypothetical protein PMW_39 [Pseudomonas phage phiPMW]|uniref:Uncharacterized protein n=1 Tax=Pseudomonas phage phiPMW TaxID=1815582 RepID=A0A1S5R181_9CAUD|nr:hypothetical protein FDG97_gp039 [Pseudomonas phage phiPMW]ANA49164.1 hypothetical protein PMW_39 [Pseudomonas phage phiPMW]